MFSSVKRVAPPPLLPLVLPAVPVISKYVPKAEKVLTLTKETSSLSINCDTVSPLPIHKRSGTARELFALLKQINGEMADDVARVVAAIGEVEDSVKLLRSERMKACAVDDRFFAGDDDRNDLQIC